MISFDEALALLLGSVRPLPPERVSLDDAAGRVLAEDLSAPTPMPAFDYSAMDGYALRLADLDMAGALALPIVGEARAGAPPDTLTDGAACRIFTGAPVPLGADAVVPQEEITRDGERLHLSVRPKLGAHIRRRGEDLQPGSLALERGRRLGPGQVTLAAALDRGELLVARRPVVTLVASGDELRPPGSAPRAGSIPESNSYFVSAAARAAGALVRRAPPVPDDLDTSERVFDAALRGTDLLVTFGGVSVGDHDHIRAGLERAGVSVGFHKVALKPGKPVLFGHRGDALVLGLPGNPASSALTFLLFGLPLLRALQGDRQPLPSPTRARFRGQLRRRTGRLEFMRASFDRSSAGCDIEARTTVRALANQASGAPTSFAQADCLLVLPPELGELQDGDAVDVLPLDAF